jgi:hypothetical protein
MKIYNPIVGGSYVNTIKGSFPPDSYKEFTEEESRKLMDEYPFLIDIEQDKYKPEFYKELKRTKCHILKTNLQKLFLALRLRK